MNRACTFLLLLLPVVLTGCSNVTSTSDDTIRVGPSSQNEESEKGGIEEVRKMYEKAGFSCPNWRISEEFSHAEESGLCGNSVRMGSFINDEKIELQIRESRIWSEENDITERHWVVGKDWIIEATSSDSAQRIASKLDGRVESF